MQMYISVIKETQFAIQTQVTQQPNFMERLYVDATIIPYFRKRLFSRFHVGPPVVKPW